MLTRKSEEKTIRTCTNNRRGGRNFECMRFFFDTKREFEWARPIGLERRNTEFDLHRVILCAKSSFPGSISQLRGEGQNCTRDVWWSYGCFKRLLLHFLLSCWTIVE